MSARSDKDLWLAYGPDARYPHVRPPLAAEIRIRAVSKMSDPLR